MSYSQQSKLFSSFLHPPNATGKSVRESFSNNFFMFIMKLVVKFSIKYPTEIVLPKYVIQNIPLNCDLFWFLPSSCGVVRLSILPSQGSDLGFKSRREHFIFGVKNKNRLFWITIVFIQSMSFCS